jgi:hypothetical protein
MEFRVDQGPGGEMSGLIRGTFGGIRAWADLAAVRSAKGRNVKMSADSL